MGSKCFPQTDLFNFITKLATLALLSTLYSTFFADACKCEITNQRVYQDLLCKVTFMEIANDND